MQTNTQSLSIDKALLGEIEGSTKGKWTLEQIASLKPAQRQSLAAYSPGVTEVKDTELIELIRVRGCTVADSLAAMTMVQGPKVTLVKQTREEVVLSKGGMTFGTEKKLTTVLPTGDKYEAANTPIPCEGLDRWPNIDAVSALLSDLVALDGEKWVERKIDGYKAFPQVKMAGLRKAGRVLAKILENTDAWKNMEAKDKLSTSGITLMKFVRSAIASLTETQFNYLNTIIVVDIYGVIEKGRDGNWLIGEDADGNELPKHFYTEKEKTSSDNVLMAQYPSVFLYKGGWVPKVKAVQVDPNLTSSVLLAQQKLIEFAGGDSNPPSILASGKDFTSMITESSKRLYFLLSATLASWAKGKVVDIRLTSDSEIHQLWSILSYWQSKIVMEKPEVFQQMTIYPVTDWFNFLPASRNKGLNVAPDIHALIRSRHRETAVAVCYLKDGIKTKTSADGPPPDHEQNSYFVLPDDLPLEYIVKCPVYGAAFFPKDDSVIRTLGKSSAKESPQKEAQKKIYQNLEVYAHGTAKGLYGVVSTFAELELIGRKMDGKKPLWVKVKLLKFPTRADWYRRVAKDILEVYAAPFKPVVRYSPICNLIVMTKGKMMLQLQDVNGEDGVITVEKTFQKTMERKAYRPGTLTTVVTPPVPVMTTQSDVKLVMSEKVGSDSVETDESAKGVDENQADADDDQSQGSEEQPNENENGEEEIAVDILQDLNE